MPILLDTTVVVDALRGRPVAERLRALRLHGEMPYVCAVTAMEVHRGLRTEEVGAAALLFTGFRVAPLDAVAGALAGVWQRDFRRRGITLGANDCLIAAAAVGVHATVVTGNPKDFPMEGVSVQHWPVGA